MEVLKVRPLGGNESFYAAADESGHLSIKDVVRRAGGSCLVELVDMTEEEYRALPATAEARGMFRETEVE